MNHARLLNDDRDRLTQLLLDRALQGLADHENSELDSLLGDEAVHDLADFALDPGGFEQAAALGALALLDRVEAMPMNLRQRMRAAPAVAADRSRAESISIKSRTNAVVGRMAWTGWLAAAACLAIALLAWWPRIVSPRELTAVQQRAALLARRPADLLLWTWTATDDPAANGLVGDIVWSDSEQRGYMRLTNLAANNPAIEQYQLWIFDAQRKAEYPVDGGVFDIPAGGEVVIPIDPKLRVFHANMFAITVEKPGGVARSDRERVPALAQPAS